MTIRIHTHTDCDECLSQKKYLDAYFIQLAHRREEDEATLEAIDKIRQQIKKEKKEQGLL